jgi:RNA polymerase sigma-70 factor (ECF subfamily)
MEFKNIYEQHKRMVFNVALHYVWKREDAEEVTQDVFIKVFEGLNQFRSESQLRTWIYRITVNTAIDFLKAKQRQKRGHRPFA